MTFCFYKNYVHCYIKIHRSDCPHANQGEGTHGLDEWERERDEWSPLFHSYEQALRAAEETAKQFSLEPNPLARYAIDNCKVCIPHLQNRSGVIGSSMGTRKLPSARRRTRRGERVCQRCGLLKPAAQFVSESEFCSDCR